MPGVAQPGGVVDQQARRFHLRRHLRQFELHALEFADGLAELLALPGVGDGVLQRAARQADHLRADRDAPLVQRLDRDLVALARLRPCTFSRGTRQLSRISSQVEDARSPSLSSFLPDLEAGELALDQERRDALVSGLRIGVGEQQEEARPRPRW